MWQEHYSVIGDKLFAGMLILMIVYSNIVFVILTSLLDIYVVVQEDLIALMALTYVTKMTIGLA
jgi:hypothetical protein